MTTVQAIPADGVAGIVYGGTWSMAPAQGPPPGYVMTCGGAPCEGLCRVTFTMKNGGVQSFAIPCDQGMTVTFLDWSTGPEYLVEW